jgi:hypothetical protein
VLNCQIDEQLVVGFAVVTGVGVEEGQLGEGAKPVAQRQLREQREYRRKLEGRLAKQFLETESERGIEGIWHKGRGK